MVCCYISKFAIKAERGYMEGSMLKLKDTNTKYAFSYGYLLRKIWPYIKAVLGRAILLFILAIPLGLLDGVVAFALRPYMDFVVNGNETQVYELCGHKIYLQAFLIKFIPFAIVLFALIQGLLRYTCNYFRELDILFPVHSVK